MKYGCPKWNTIGESMKKTAAELEKAIKSLKERYAEGLKMLDIAMNSKEYEIAEMIRITNTALCTVIREAEVELDRITLTKDKLKVSRDL